MNTIMKKSTSLICVLTMCFMTMSVYFNPVQANDRVASDIIATNTEINTELALNDINQRLTKDSVAVKDSSVSKINSDMEILGKTGVVFDSKEQIVDITLDSDGNINYLVKIGEYENLVSIESDSPDRIEMNFQQGDISNIVTICDDGRIYLDGNLIDTETSTDEKVVANNVEIWTSGCPYGSYSDYSNYLMSDNCSNVPFYNTVQSIAVGAFIAIIGNLMGVPFSGSLFTSALGSLYTYMIQNDPTSTSMSYKATVYTMNSGTGYISSSVGWVYRYKFNYYTRANYSDYAYTRYYYRHLLPY